MEGPRAPAPRGPSPRAMARGWCPWALPRQAWTKVCKIGRLCDAVILVFAKHAALQVARFPAFNDIDAAARALESPRRARRSKASKSQRLHDCLLHCLHLQKPRTASSLTERKLSVPRPVNLPSLRKVRSRQGVIVLISVVLSSKK